MVNQTNTWVTLTFVFFIINSDNTKYTCKSLLFFVFKKKAARGKSAYRSYKQNAQQKNVKAKRVITRTARNEKTVKQLLGELYGDKQYLEKLLLETGNWDVF